MNAQKNRIVIVVTSHSDLGSTGKKTGYHLEELAVPYLEFKRSGAEIVIASPKGGQPPVDPKSAQKDSPEIQEFLNDPEASKKMKSTIKIADVDGSIDLLFFPGGHGPMWDLATSDETTDLVEQVWRDGGVIAALCHGPAALINARDESGEPLVAGKKLNSFTDEEEKAGELYSVVPFHLEAKLRSLGAKFENSGKQQPHVAHDGRLITGQNPASAKGVAQAALAALDSAEMGAGSDASDGARASDTGTTSREYLGKGGESASQRLADERVQSGRPGLVDERVSKTGAGQATAGRKTVSNGRIGTQDGERASNGRVMRAEPDSREISSRYEGGEQITDRGSDSGHSVGKSTEERGLASPELNGERIEAREQQSGRANPANQTGRGDSGSMSADGSEDRLPSGLTSDARSEPNTLRAGSISSGSKSKRDIDGDPAHGDVLHDDLPQEQRTQAQRTKRQELDPLDAANLTHKNTEQKTKAPRNPRR